MIEAIRAYRGISRGTHGERWVRVTESTVYRCTECKQAWESRTTAQGHHCPKPETTKKEAS